jgi:hypothetical protein
MATTISSITYAVAVERIKRRIFNGWPTVAENLSNNELLLYLYEAIALVMVQTSNNGLQVDGIRSIPEGFITTYKFTSFTKDTLTGYYTFILPHAPIGLPLGYSILSPYFASASGTSYPLIAVHPYQRGYYDKIASPKYGIFYFVENNDFYIDFRGADAMAVGTLYVPMLSPRPQTGNDTDLVNLPDDAMSMVFDIVVNKLTQRLKAPQDNLNDGVYDPTPTQ